jgi:hypothetical protein
MKKCCGIVLLISAFASSAFAQRYAVFPRFVSGGGWTSDLSLTNQGTSTVTGINVSFYDPNGHPLSVVSSLGNGSSFDFSLASGATRVLSVTPGSALVEGYIVATYPSFNSAVRGNQIFRYEQSGTVHTEVGVPQQEQGDHFTFPVEVHSDQGVRTAVALTNPVGFNSAAETLVVNLIGTDGAVRDVATVELQPGQHLARFLDEADLFPGLDNFSGSVSVSSPLGAAVLAFRQDKQAFGSVATEGGPVLGPFVLEGSVIAEQEPNDTDLDAQPLSGSRIVTGTIGTVEDIDVFYFEGKKGNIVSVVCDTQGTNSMLDSILAVFDGDLIQIAYNDQNGLAPGLYPQNDSFIQMVLPQDGIYYIGIYDFLDEGGANFTYTLHVKLP